MPGAPINARAETVATSPMFRQALAKRRCLVPADAFYEWKAEAGGKRPVAIAPRSGEGMAFAGLWESWRGPHGMSLETVTIITTEPNALMASIHDRMPVVLGDEDHDAWLEAARPGGAALLRPCPAEWLEAVPVSARVNSPRNDDPGLLEREPMGEPEEAARGTLI